MKGTQEIFCDNMKQLRVAKKLSQGELAHQIGMEQTQISRIENGKVEPGIGTVEKIANGLGISSAELLIDSNGQESSLNEKLLQIPSLNEYDQKLIEALLENFIEKNRLENMQDLKMKSRLEELDEIRG